MKRRNILLGTLSVPLLHAQDDSFTGTPLVRVEADGTEVKRLEISPDAGAKAQCRIATTSGRAGETGNSSAPTPAIGPTSFRPTAAAT